MSNLYFYVAGVGLPGCNRFKYRRIHTPQKSSLLLQIYLGIYSHLTKYVHTFFFFFNRWDHPTHTVPQLAFALAEGLSASQARTRGSASLSISGIVNSIP